MKKLTLALAALLTPALLAVPAFASGSERPGGDFAGGSGGGRDLGRIQAAVDDLVDVMGQVWAVMTANPFFLVLLAGSLLALGVRIFRKVKGAAK